MEKAPFEERERAIADSFKELQRQQRELLEWQQRLEKREADLTQTGSLPADTTSAAGPGSSN